MINTKINQSDLKFYPSERLDDTDEGGGLPIGTPVKGVANEIFKPISSLASVNGDFDNVLLYGGVQRPDSEPLIGSFVAITKPPKNPVVSYLLFGANFGELRKDGVRRIENYSIATIESPMTLLSNPAKGSRIVQAYQRVGEKLPSIGDVYCLRYEKDGRILAEQYIQMVKIEATERTFTDADGREFVRMVVKMEISQVLNHDFVGVDYPSPRYANAPTKIRETHVADAAAYYGIKPLVQEAKKGSSSLKISSITEKIVPTTQMETPIVDALASRQAPVIFDAAFGAASVYLTLRNIGSYHLLPLMPGSLDFLGVSDEGGRLLFKGEQIGTIDYKTGILNLQSAQSLSGLASFRPATTTSPIADSFRIDIGIKNRSYNHVMTLPNIGAGSVSVSYMAQGRWYELLDDGAGRLVGVSKEHGSGSVNYRTGSVTLTCGHMPDVGSAIIFSVGTSAKAQKLTDTPTMYFSYAIDNTPNLETLNVSAGNLSQKANKKGEFKGNLNGFYDNGRVFIQSQGINTPQNATISYHTGQRQTITINAPSRDTGGQVVLNLSDTAISPGSVELQFPVTLLTVKEEGKGKFSFTNEGKLIQRLYDDGVGNLTDVSGAKVGTIDYTNATAKFSPTSKVATVAPGYKTEYYTVRHGGRLFGPKYVTATRQVYAGFIPKQLDAVLATDGSVQASFYDNTQGGLQNQTLATKELAIYLKQNPYDGVSIATGSVVFSLAGQLYWDKNGVMYTNLNPANGASVKAGTIDYTTGVVLLHDFAQSNSYDLTLLSGAVTSSFLSTDAVSFRTATAPIRHASLQIKAIATDGTVITTTADSDGILDGEWIAGRVDAKFGLVTVSFGKWQDTNKTGDGVNDGKIWQPKQVISGSITYNAVSVSHLPIDSTSIKIDTVRLPSDGLVPIYRRGDTILITNRQIQNIGSAHRAGETVQLDRQNLDRICVMDDDDKPVLATLWDYDLDAGSITWQSPLDLSAYKMPLKVMHAIEEKNRVIQTDIDGTLSLMFPIKNDYELANTYVSSVLIGGDLQVGFSRPFTQPNWDNVWRDTPNGDELLNRLNVKDYPMILTDDGAITERWIIRFKSASQFDLYGQTLGFVMSADTLSDLAPINPATNKPYFTLKREAFGGAQGQAPWQAQNIIRFNTTSTLLPFWVIRSVTPTSDKQVGTDGFSLCLFGDTTAI